MIYIKFNNRYKTLKEIANEFDLPIKLIQGRYNKHKKGQISFEELIKPKISKAK